MDPFHVATPKFGFLKPTPVPVAIVSPVHKNPPPLFTPVPSPIAIVSPARAGSFPIMDVAKTFIEAQLLLLQSVKIVGSTALGIIRPLLPPPAQVAQTVAQIMDSIQKQAQAVLFTVATPFVAAKRALDNGADIVRQVQLPSGQDILASILHPFQVVGTAIYDTLPSREDVASTVTAPFKTAKRAIEYTMGTIRQVQFPSGQDILATMFQPLQAVGAAIHGTLPTRENIVSTVDSSLRSVKRAVNNTVDAATNALPSKETVFDSFRETKRAITGTLQKIPRPSKEGIFLAVATPFALLAYPINKIATYFRKNAQNEGVNEALNAQSASSSNTTNSTSESDIDIEALKEKIRRAEESFVTGINDYEQQEAALQAYENLIANKYIGRNYSYKDGVDRFLREIRNYAGTSQNQTEQQRHLDDLQAFEPQLKDSNYNNPNAKFDPIINICLANLKNQNSSEKDELLTHRTELKRDYDTLTKAGGTLPPINRTYQNLWTKYNPGSSSSSLGIHTD